MGWRSRSNLRDWEADALNGSRQDLQSKSDDKISSHVEDEIEGAIFVVEIVGEGVVVGALRFTAFSRAAYSS